MHNTLYHVTLNSGHVADLPHVLPGSAEAMTGIARNGGDLGHLLPQMAGWSIDLQRDDAMGAASFYVGFEGIPAVECIVCWRDAESARAWQILERLYLDLSDTHMEAMAATAMPVLPPRVPWLGTVILPSAVVLAARGIKRFAALGEIERIVAWSIIDDATSGEVQP